MAHLPNDDSQISRAGEVGRARDANPLSSGSVEGGPTAAGLVDAGVLIGVRLQIEKKLVALETDV